VEDNQKVIIRSETNPMIIEVKNIDGEYEKLHIINQRVNRLNLPHYFRLREIIENKDQIKIFFYKNPKFQYNRTFPAFFTYFSNYFTNGLYLWSNFQGGTNRPKYLSAKKNLFQSDLQNGRYR
jgi:hypothetical protein